METTLNFEELGNHTRPPFRATDTAFLDILGVVGRDDVLARLRVVHDGLGVREETVEAPVEDAGRDEGVDVADAETVFRVDLVSIATNVTTSSCARSWMGVKAFGRKGKRMREKKAYRCCPPIETPVLPLPAATMLLTKPGSGGMQPMKKAATARQLLAYLGE